MHEKLRLELIIEPMALRQAYDILEEAGLTGYTTLSAKEGFGRDRRWTRSGDLSATESMAVVISIGDRKKVEAALEKLHELLESQIGVLSVGVVQVLRPNRF